MFRNSPAFRIPSSGLSLLMSSLAAWIVDVEGGYVNDSRDPGGETKFGISKRAYPHLNIREITEHQAMQIYEKDYIEPVRRKVADERMVWLVADAAVQHGLSRALDWLESYPTFDAYLSRRIRFYTRLSNFDHFGRGWMNRIAKLMEAISRLDEPGVVEHLADHRDLSTRLLAAVKGTSGPVAYRIRNMSSGTGRKMDIA